MSKMVPEGWTDIKLKDLLLKTDSGGWGENGTCNDIPVLRSTNIMNNGQLSYEKIAFRKFSEKNKLDFLKHGDMLIEKSGGSNDWSVGRVVYFDEIRNHYYFANFMQRMRVNSEKAFWKYIFYFLFDFYRKGGTKNLFQKTTGIQNLRINEYLLQHIPLPPLPEQRKIAAILSSVDNAIEKTKEVIEQTKILKKSLMQELLIRGIPGRHKKFKKTPIGVIPEEWEVVRLKDISGLITSGARGWARYYSDDGPIFLRIGNLTRDHINLRLDNLVHVDLPENNVEGIRTAAKDGDILISVTADLGIIGVMPSNFEEAYVNQHIALVRIKASSMNPRWVGHFLSAVTGQSQFRSLNDAGSKSGLNLNTIASLKIAKPKKDEQDEITRVIDNIDTYIEKELFSLASLHSMKSSLLQILLTGEVRVKI